MNKRIRDYLKTSTNPEEHYWFHSLLNQITHPDEFGSSNGEVTDLLELMEENQKRKRYIRKRWIQWTLATTGFALMSILVIFYYSSTISNEKIFDKYYSSYKVNNKKIIRMIVTNSSFKNINDLINKGNYKEAIPQLRKVIENDSTNTTAYFLLSMSFMETNNYQEAIKNLLYIVDRDESIKEQTEWYLALCYLKTKQNKEAMLFLNDLAERHFYQSSAADIIKKLKR